MDEVDGISPTDKGGLAVLVKLIKETLMPIVCIANDKSGRQLKHLVNVCYDLKFIK